MRLTYSNSRAGSPPARSRTGAVNRAGQIGGPHDDLLDQDLLVVLHALALVRVELLAQWSVFRQGDAVRQARVSPRDPVVGAVDVLAAHRHDPPGDALEDADQVPRLVLVHGYHVEHHLGRDAPELPGEALQVFPVAPDTPDTLGEIRRRQAPVEHDDLVAGPGKPPHHVRADEVRAADDEDPYLPASPPVRMATSSGERASRRGAPRVTRRTKPGPICLG